MTTEEVLLTVLTVSITVLIIVVLIVLFMILRVVKKIDSFADEVQGVINSGSDVVKSLAPITIAANMLRVVRIIKKRK